MIEHLIKPWDGVISHPLAGRSSKPRSTGVTMVIDKGLGLAETESLFEMASDYIDYVKLGFGTSALYSPHILTRKLELAESYGVTVYPGGTAFEIAFIQGRLDEYLQRAQSLGFRMIEVSDGTIDIDRSTRDDIIAQAVSEGFTVFSEVGKKDEASELSGEALRLAAAADLRAGALKVIVEGRESGVGVGIYDEQGGIKPDSLSILAAGLPVENIIWEAPMKKQQEELIIAFGPDVNLGNIPVGEVFALEAMRVGLRGDTLKVALEMGR